jgi:DNA-binding response OmpR family regulator
VAFYFGKKIALSKGDGGKKMNKKRNSTNGGTREGGDKMKPVLIVEDEAIMREALSDWLRDEGYEVETAEEGERALEKLAQQDFGVAVLDLRLPGRDGIEVLRQAREQNPDLKGIIITAYPSVETAVEAMKIGAVDYVVKPFAPDALEKSIQEVLGATDVEARAEETKDQAAEAPVVEEEAAEETVAISEEEIPTHMEQGKAHFQAGQFREALREFHSILGIAPGDIETRVWIQRTEEELAKPEVGTAEAGAAVEEAVRPKECLWSKMGVVSYRVCTRDYDCLTCEFDQMMQEKMAAGETAGLDEALERLKELPGCERICRYALKGDVSYRLCTRLFQCETCEFGQLMQDALAQKMAKLAARREALRKKEERASA